MSASSLHARAMLVTLNIRTWSARKYDKKVTAETNKAHGADEDAGRYNKSLMPADAASYKALTQHCTAARDRHYSETLAWNDEGKRLLPIKAYKKYVDQIRADQHEFNRLLDAFVADYPALRLAAKAKLNGMWNEDDYPENIRQRFSFGYQPSPVPDGGDYRVELSQEEIDILATSTEQNVREAFEAAQNDAVKRLFKVVAKMHERLTTINTCKKCEGKGTTIETRKIQLQAIEERLTIAGKQHEIGKPVEVTCWICDGAGQNGATFRDSLMENAIEVCDVLTRINLTEDPKLEALRKKVEALATTTTPEALRDDVEVRNDTAAEAQSILDAMSKTFGKGLFS